MPPRVLDAGSIFALLLGVVVVARAHAVDLSVEGDWVCNRGKVRAIPIVTPGNWNVTIEQSGNLLKFTDENGRKATGRISDDDVITAPDWKDGNLGYIGMGIDGMFFRYQDAIRRFSLRPDQDWPFIRWESGVICVKPRLPAR